MDRALGYGPRGWGFYSLRARWASHNGHKMVPPTENPGGSCRPRVPQRLLESVARPAKTRDGNIYGIVPFSRVYGLAFSYGSEGWGFGSLSARYAPER